MATTHPALARDPTSSEKPAACYLGAGMYAPFRRLARAVGPMPLPRRDETAVLTATTGETARAAAKAGLEAGLVARHGAAVARGTSTRVT